MTGVRIALGVGLIGLAACPAPARAPATPAAGVQTCRADIPADLSHAPAIWLGDCRAGVADGLGVTRAGSDGSYDFFAGRMRGGHPATGVIVLASGLMKVAVRFDANRRAIVSDGLQPGEDEAVFRTATAAATAVSQRFAAAGNRRSASFYAKLAERIKAAPPE